MEEEERGESGDRYLIRCHYKEKLLFYFLLLFVLLLYWMVGFIKL